MYAVEPRAALSGFLNLDCYIQLQVSQYEITIGGTERKTPKFPAHATQEGSCLIFL